MLTNLWRKRADEKLVAWAKARFVSWFKPIVLKAPSSRSFKSIIKDLKSSSFIYNSAPVIWAPKRNIIYINIADL